MPKPSTSAYVEPIMDEMCFPIYNVEPIMDDMGFPIYEETEKRKFAEEAENKELLTPQLPEISKEDLTSGEVTEKTKNRRALFLPKTTVEKTDEANSAEDQVNCFGKKSSDAFQEAYTPAEKSSLTGRPQIDPQKNLEAPKETGNYNRNVTGKTSGPDSRLKPTVAEADAELSGSAEKSRGTSEPSQEDKFKKGGKKQIFGTNISVTPKMDSETPNIGSDFSKEASGGPKDDLRTTQVDPKSSKMGSKSSKMGPKVSKLGQKSKMAQKSSKTDPKDSEKDLEGSKFDLKASESGPNSGSILDPVVEQETKSTDTGWTSWWFGGKSSQPSIKENTQETSGKPSSTNEVDQKGSRTNEDSPKVEGSSGSSKLTQKTSKIGKKSSKPTTGKSEGVDQKSSGKDLKSKNSEHQQFPEKVGTTTGTDLEPKTSKSKRTPQSTGVPLQETNSQLDSSKVPKVEKGKLGKKSSEKVLKRRHSNQQYPERVDTGTRMIQKTSTNQLPELEPKDSYKKQSPDNRRRLNAGTQSPIKNDKQIPEAGPSQQKLPPKTPVKQSQSSGWFGSWFGGGQTTPAPNPDEDDIEKASATGTIVDPHCSSCCHKPEEIFPEVKTKRKMGPKGSTKSLPEKRKKGPNLEEETQGAEIGKKPAELPKNITKTKVVEVGDNKASIFPSWFPFGRSATTPEETPAEPESDEDLSSKIGLKTSSDSTGPDLKKKSSTMGPKTSKTSPGSFTPEEATIPIPDKKKSTKKSSSRSKSPFGKGSKAPKELLEIDKDDSLEGIVGPIDPTIARVEPTDKKRSKKVKFGKRSASPLVFDHKKPPKEPKVPEKPFDDDEDVSAIRFEPPKRKKSGEAVDKKWKDPDVDKISASPNISASSSSKSIGKKPKETKSTGWFGGFFGKKNIEKEGSDEDLETEDSERDLSKDSRKLPDSRRPESRGSRVTKELTSDDFRMPKKRSKNQLEPPQVDLATNKTSFNDLMADMREKEKPTPPLPAPSGSPRSGSPRSGSPRNRSPQPSASKPPKKARGLKGKRESKKASDSGPPSDSKRDHFKPEYRQEPRTSKDFGKKGAQTGGPKPQKIEIGSFFEPNESSGPSGGPSAGPSGARGRRATDPGRPRSPESGRTPRTFDRNAEPPPPRRYSKDKSKDKKPKKERRISKEINKRKARKGGPLENVIIDEDYGDRIIYSGYDRAFAYPRGKDKGCNRDMLGEDEEYDRKIYSGYDRAFARKRCVKAMFVKEEYDSPRPLCSDRGGPGVGVGRTDCDRYGQSSNKPQRYREPKYDGTRRDPYDDYWDRYERDKQKYVAREERRKNKCLGWII